MDDYEDGATPRHPIRHGVIHGNPAPGGKPASGKKKRNRRGDWAKCAERSDFGPFRVIRISEVACGVVVTQEIGDKVVIVSKPMRCSEAKAEAAKLYALWLSEQRP